MNPSRIRERLRELGLSHSRFADISGVSESTLKRTLSGGAVRPSTAAIMATALGTTVEWLNGTDEAPSEPALIEIEPTSGPTSAPIEPTSEPALDVHFLVSNMTASYDKALAVKDEVIRQKNKWISVLAVALGVVILAAILLLGYDIANASIGWVQY